MFYFFKKIITIHPTKMTMMAEEEVGQTMVVGEDLMAGTLAEAILMEAEGIGEGVEEWRRWIRD